MPNWDSISILNSTDSNVSKLVFTKDGFSVFASGMAY